MTRWQFDPDWRYFVRDVDLGLGTIQSIITEESVTDHPAWAETQGLDPETVDHLFRHPTPGAYRTESSPSSVDD